MITTREMVAPGGAPTSASDTSNSNNKDVNLLQHGQGGHGRGKGCYHGCEGAQGCR